MDTRAFDYQLPPGLIAQHPPEARDRSRLLVLHRRDRRLEDRLFPDLTAYLQAGDLLVLNDTKVIPARLHGVFQEGGVVEVLLVEEREPDRWEALIKPSKKARPGRKLLFAPGLLEAEVEGWISDGRVFLRLVYEGSFRALLQRYGLMPLPPYITSHQPSAISHQLNFGEWYQTVYAKEEGAIAAPTAGLHFTWKLLEQLQGMGVSLAFLTLHVGVGTFKPVRVEAVRDHRMEPERYWIPEETAQAIKTAKEEGQRVVAVGTTTVRALEHSAKQAGEVKAGEGSADLFIYPGYRFKVIDVLITNFHLPQSTPLMLVSAFAGKEFLFKAYQHAILRRYRFYSFGDAMLIL
ncbi:MAG: tRNA preQ1(34) S-adenosylmethionine ribosyltransferase-isomerase QueA [candidate division NC10 bacterium]|nr:tRNA preQ1(34) S-adenosylmethionine ribosyltransferase-isomerase QueA [candidate division NC10 bacterium]